MAVTVRANSKDENCFAQAASRTQAGLHELAPPKGGNGRANREKGRPVRLFHGLKGSDFPLDIRREGTRKRLLSLAGKSSLAQLPERHLAVHGLAVGLARVLHGEGLTLCIDFVFNRHVIALDRAGHLRLAQLTFVAAGKRFALFEPG